MHSNPRVRAALTALGIDYRLADPDHPHADDIACGVLAARCDLIHMQSMDKHVARVEAGQQVSPDDAARLHAAYLGGYHDATLKMIDAQGGEHMILMTTVAHRVMSALGSLHFLASHTDDPATEPAAAHLQAAVAVLNEAMGRHLLAAELKASQ